MKKWSGNIRGASPVRCFPYLTLWNKSGILDLKSKPRSFNFPICVLKE